MELVKDPPVKPGLKIEWTENVMDAALDFVRATQAAFDHGMKTSETYLPDPKDRSQRATQADMFFEAMIGVCVERIATYANSSKEFENLVHNAITNKFFYIRKKQQELAETDMSKPQ